MRRTVRRVAAALMPRIFHITTRAAWDDAQRGRQLHRRFAADRGVHPLLAGRAGGLGGQHALSRPHRSGAAARGRGGAWAPRCGARTWRAATTLFPHIYGPLPVRGRVDVTPMVPAPDGTFDLDRRRLRLRRAPPVSAAHEAGYRPAPSAGRQTRPGHDQRQHSPPGTATPPAPSSARNMLPLGCDASRVASRMAPSTNGLT